MELARQRLLLSLLSTLPEKMTIPAAAWEEESVRSELVSCQSRIRMNFNSGGGFDTGREM